MMFSKNLMGSVLSEYKVRQRPWERETGNLPVRNKPQQHQLHGCSAILRTRFIFLIKPGPVPSPLSEGP